MKILREFFKNQKKTKGIIILLAYTVFMVLTAILLSNYVDKESLHSLVKRAGSFGIFLFLLIEFIYVVFTPLYNTAIHIAAGYIFGGSLGFLLNFVATTIGLFTIIFIVKKYGRPILKKLIKASFYYQYDKLIKKIGPIFLFIIYVLPFTPDDEMTYIIAAGPVSIKRYILPILLGNISKSAMSYIGDQGVIGLSIAALARIIILIVGLIIIGIQEYLIKRKKLKFNNI